MNTMELVYFGDDGRLYIDHDCEMCNKYPMEDLNEECLACGHSKNALLDLESRISLINKAVDFYNTIAENEDVHNLTEVITADLTLSHVSVGGNDCDKITFCDHEDTGFIANFAKYVRQNCTVVVYPHGLEEEDYIVYIE